MKINMPVTANELFLDPARPIVTKTDLKGAITYANRAFIDISGYSEDELLGRNHNIVRHPDMPPEAFGDLWDTIKQGKPWRGLVKNRAKSGDFYWVEAYVTPLTEHGKLIGYISVRSTPKRDEIAAAEAFYVQLRNKQAAMPSTLQALQKRSDSGRAGFVLTGIFSAGLLLAAVWPGLADVVRQLVGGISFVGLGAASYWWRHREGVVMERIHHGFMALSEGRLEHPLRTHLGGQLGAMMDSLEGLRLHQRALVADSLSAGGLTYQQARSLSGEVEGLVARAREQGTGLHHISTSMEEISGSVAQVATMAEQSEQGADATRQAATTGQAVMQSAANAAVQAVDSVHRSKADLLQLEQAMGKISSMTDLIHEIAEQTNLLALNAAIEAARAGEMGRGFAVVADEVRKLAERTAQATDGITETVQHIVAITDSVSGNMDQSVIEVGQVSNEIRQSGEHLQNLLQIADQARQFAHTLVEQMAQQSSSVHQVAASVEQLAMLGEQNIATADAVLGSSQHLELAASDLDKLTRDYRKWHSNGR
ncbi:methyl-accepting chemotaxis protein [Vogesella facilis]|uniref:Methyl-accepting chemotaxis protein n=1 Tax=Vogesella facilis TaxID=1655232 RepID=A0ABV7RCN3_9NEIS